MRLEDKKMLEERIAKLDARMEVLNNEFDEKLKNGEDRDDIVEEMYSVMRSTNRYLELLGRPEIEMYLLKWTMDTMDAMDT